MSVVQIQNYHEIYHYIWAITIAMQFTMCDYQIKRHKNKEGV